MMRAADSRGFISKLRLIQGAEMAVMECASWMLTASSLLNADHLLPILYRLGFVNQPQKWLQERYSRQGCCGDA